MSSGTYRHPKDPDEVLDYAFDFSALLAEAESVAAHDVTASDVTIDGTGEEAGVVTVWLSGGTAGRDAAITYRIVTDSTPARTFERTALLRIRQR